jgi:hypothetical protein
MVAKKNGRGAAMPIEDAVSKHYRRRHLAPEILAALGRDGRDVGRLALDDLAPLDEFHVRGRAATVELGDALVLRPAVTATGAAAASLAG